METAPNTPVIDIDGLSIRYTSRHGRNVEAVRDLRLAVQEGEIVGFIGPNGAGKTSTIKVLMGFMEPSDGTARVLGQRAGSVAARECTGYLPEVALYYPFLSARETLRLYAELQGVDRLLRESLVDALLARVRLSERADERLRTYSKGMLQRVGIAQAIMGDPELLILDEVTAGLDPIARHDVREILLDFKYRGRTVFFSSHELSEVALICDRIVLIDRGSILEEQRLETLLASLHRFRVVVLGAWRPERLPDQVRGPENADGNTVFVAESELAYHQLLALAAKEGRTVASWTQEPGSLEAYFVERVGHKVT